MKIKPISVRFTQQRGFSLLEALLSIVIILAAGLGVVELYLSADKKNKLQATEQIAQQVASAAAQLLSSTYDAADTISTADVINSGLLAQSVISKDGKTIQGPSGITFEAYSLTGGTHEQFYVVVNKLPYVQAVGLCQDMFANFAIFGIAVPTSTSAMLATLSKCASTFNVANSTGNGTESLYFGAPKSTFAAA